MEQVFLWWVSWSNRVGREGGRQAERGEGGGDISDGHSITARMWNRSFSGGCPGLIGEGGREGDRKREERGEETSVMGTASQPGCGTGLSLVGVLV